nr:DUF6543 domain-containing protein [Pseudomonas sp. B21-032]
MSAPEQVPSAATSPADFSAASLNLEFLRQQLPAWLRSAPPALLAKLSVSMRACEASRAARARLLAPLQSVQVFAQARFDEALRRRFGSRLKPTGDRLIRVNRLMGGWQAPGLKWLWQRNYTEQGLLQAALHNFTAAEQQSDSALVRMSSFRHAGRRVQGVSVLGFVRFCRELDLGGQYQKHIDSVFDPDGVVGIPQSTRELFRECDRYALQVDAHVALMRGAISAAMYKQVLEISELKTGIQEQGVPLRLKRLKLAGIELRGVSVFEFSFQPLGHLAAIQRSWVRLLVHIPQDPFSPLKEYAGWDEFEQDLAGKLSRDSYRQFFMRLALRRQWPALHTQLQNRLFEQRNGQRVALSSPSLALDAILRPEPLFEDLFNQCLEQLQDDARFIAVPTATLDASERQAALDKALEIGLDVLGLAAFVVPGLGEVLFGVVASQLMKEVFTGLDDWAEGDRHEAFNCLTHVVGEVAGLAAGAVVVGTAATLVRNSALFKALALVRKDNGALRLCLPDLKPYALDLDSTIAGTASEQGIYQIGEQQVVRIEDSFYRVEQDAETGSWRICHPVRSGAWAPVLEHNGKGAWRSRFDSPHRWQGSQYLFRRLGPSVEDLGDEEVTSVLAVSGADEAQLRQLHLHRRPPSGALVDACERARLQRRLQRFSQQLQNPAAVADESLLMRALQLMPSSADEPVPQGQVQEWLKANWRRFSEHCLAAERPPVSSLVARDFPGLGPAMVEEIEASATSAERLRMADGRRVPLRLARQARQALGETRLAHALEGFFWPQMANTDCDRLLLHMLMQDPRWPAALELGIEGVGPAVQGPTLIRRGDLYIDGQRPEAAPRDLLELAWELAGLDVVEDLPALRRQLGVQAGAQRAMVGRVLGGVHERWWTPLQRFADGRLGYALSGGGARLPVSPRSIEEEILELYPDYSAQEIAAYLEPYRARPAEARALLQRRREELQGLQSGLRRWQGASVDSEQALGRQQFSERLVQAWRHQSPGIRTPLGRTLGYRLDLGGLMVGELPGLQAVDLHHVLELDMAGMNLATVPAEFLAHFGRLRYLDLSGNELALIPPAIENRLSLQNLRLSNNRIVLDARDAARIGDLLNLDSLHLEGNPLGIPPDVSRLPQLRILTLNNTEITRVPESLHDRSRLEWVDLSDNQISQLPEHFLEEPRSFLRMIELEGNALSDEQYRRLRRLQAPPTPVRVAAGDAAQQFWTGPASANRQLVEYWQRLRNEPQAGNLMTVLERLAQTVEAQEQSESMRTRVAGILHYAVEGPMAEDLLRFAGDPQQSIGHPLLAFENLESRVQGHRALLDALQEHGPRQLLDFARASFNREELRRFVIDQVLLEPELFARRDELQLLYQQELYGRLALPGDARDLILTDLALSTAQLDAALAHVQGAQVQARLPRFMTRQPNWVEYLHQRHASAWLELDVRFNQLSAAQRLREAGLPEAERLQLERGRQLQQAMDEAALLLRLTREALGIPAAPGG